MDYLSRLVESPFIAEPDPGEYAWSLADAGETDAALDVQGYQYAEGYAAAYADLPFADYKPAAWRLGWTEAQAYMEDQGYSRHWSDDPRHWAA